jgi:hypothetical protein
VSLPQYPARVEEIEHFGVTARADAGFAEIVLMHTKQALMVSC